MLLPYFLAAFLLLNVSFAQPVPDSTTEALVVVSDETAQNNEETKVEHRPPEMKSMHVVSNVRNRYARTVVTSMYTNPDNRAQQAKFSIVLPDTAFIAGFVMEIEGKQYEAYVRDKAQAEQEYEQAISHGLGAAHIAVGARDSNRFTVSVNIEPQSKVIFVLTYEELLVRKHGKYEIVINLNPGQLLKDLGVDVHINETRPIVNVETPALRSGNEITAQDTKNDYASLKQENDGGIHVSFHPTVEQQKEMAKTLKDIDETKGISGQFVVKYDVERDPLGGEVLVNDGYFVHFFAPSELKPIPKHVVFVLDVSASMIGRKIKQLKEAMKVILGELNPDDYFSLVKFHTIVYVLDSNKSWEHIISPTESELPQGLAANAENIKNAQEVVDQMTPAGSTNINGALITGLRLLSKEQLDIQETKIKHKLQPIIVFLTDGQPNVGEARPDKMIEMVEERNNKENKAAIFTLAFGRDANNIFLKELAARNTGFSRIIFEAADASLQLEDFYRTISSPLLTNVNFKYSEEVEVQDLTKHNFDFLFSGSEFVVAGKINKQVDKFVTVEGSSVDRTNKLFYPSIIHAKLEKYGSLERLWAYLSIKQLLDNDNKFDKNALNKNSTEGETPIAQATKLALRYSFVTPVTSLVVVKPNETHSTSADEDYDDSYGSNDKIFGVVSVPLIIYGPPHINLIADRPIDFRVTDTQTFTQPPAHASPPAEIITTTETVTTTDYKDQPTWLHHLISGAGKITIDQKEYEIGNNGTSVEHKTCKVKSLHISGSCTLLSACPKIYDKINSFETYKTYFCTLESERYAGVCCPEQQDEDRIVFFD